MSTKLTLSIDKNVIAEAKKYAKKHGRSLSSLVEDYFKVIANADRKKDKTFEPSPLAKELWGSVREPDPKEDYRDVVANELLKKYGYKK